jgi:predicted  nucleic acid-binding Zn-ribbon protein
MSCKFVFEMQGGCQVAKCISCGRVVRGASRNILAICRNDFARTQDIKPGLGDRVADGLAAVGITKERVSKLIGKDCGCKKRQEALNRLGQRAAEAVRKLTGQDATNATPEEQERRVDD